MTSIEMYQEFQVLMDKIDSQDLPEIYPEQVFTFLNIAVDEYVQAIRANFEENGKIADDGISLVKRIFIVGESEEDRVKFDYEKALLRRPDSSDQDFVSIYYLMNARIESHIGDGINIKRGITEINPNQQDDITVSLGDPFNEPKYADKVPTVKEDQALYATPPPYLSLDLLIGTAILAPAKISKTVNCDLRKQVHKTIVKRAVQLALEDVESQRIATFNK